jgi:hypothetical protein
VNIAKLNNDVKQNRDESLSESVHKNGVTLEYFPCVLKDAIDEWGQELRGKRDHQFLNYYKELSMLTNRAESTLRSFTNEYQTVFPTVDVLYAICKAIDNFAPIEYMGELK